jgi:hypothetical protein
MSSIDLPEEIKYEILRILDKNGSGGKSINQISIALTAYLGRSFGTDLLKKQMIIFESQGLISEVEGRFETLTKLRRSLFTLPGYDFPHFKTTIAGKTFILNYEKDTTPTSVEKGLLSEYKETAERIEKKLGELSNISSRLDRNEDQIKDFYVRIIEIFGVFVAIFALIFTGTQITFSGEVPDDAIGAFIYCSAIIAPIAIVIGLFIILLERTIVRRGRRF